MGKKEGWRKSRYGPQLALTVKSHMLSILREELGLGRQPRVARILIDELFEAVDECYQSVEAVKPGQVILLLPRVGHGAGMNKSMEQCPLVRVRLTLTCEEDIEALVSGKSISEVRVKRLCRMVREAFAQGGAITVVQLALLTGISSTKISAALRNHMRKSGEILPLRGIIDDMSPAISHKAAIIRCYLKGMSTSEIAGKTDHSPRAIERYVRRFNQIRELVRYLGEDPDPAVIARIVSCGSRLVRAYLELLPDKNTTPEVIKSAEPNQMIESAPLNV